MRATVRVCVFEWFFRESAAGCSISWAVYNTSMLYIDKISMGNVLGADFFVFFSISFSYWKSISSLDLFVVAVVVRMECQVESAVQILCGIQFGCLSVCWSTIKVYTTYLFRILIFFSNDKNPVLSNSTKLHGVGANINLKWNIFFFSIHPSNKHYTIRLLLREILCFWWAVKMTHNIVILLRFISRKYIWRSLQLMKSYLRLYLYLHFEFYSIFLRFKQKLNIYYAKLMANLYHIAPFLAIHITNYSWFKMWQNIKSFIQIRISFLAQITHFVLGWESISPFNIWCRAIYYMAWGGGWHGIQKLFIRLIWIWNPLLHVKFQFKIDTFSTKLKAKLISDYGIWTALAHLFIKFSFLFPTNKQTNHI